MDTTSRINFMITDNEICFGDKCYKYVIGYDFFELGKENYLYYNIDDRQVVVGYKANSNGILFYKSIDLGDSIKYEKMPFLSLQKVES